VDHSVRGSMKNAVNCDNKYELQILWVPCFWMHIAPLGFALRHMWFRVVLLQNAVDSRICRVCLWTFQVFPRLECLLLLHGLRIVGLRARRFVLSLRLWYSCIRYQLSTYGLFSFGGRVNWFSLFIAIRLMSLYHCSGRRGERFVLVEGQSKSFV